MGRSLFEEQHDVLDRSPVEDGTRGKVRLGPVRRRSQGFDAVGRFADGPE